MIKIIWVILGWVLTVNYGSTSTDVERYVNIPAGDATTTLSQFATESGLEIIYRSDILKGVTTEPVVGTFTPVEVVVQMLSETGLELVLDDASGALLVKTHRNGSSVTPKELRLTHDQHKSTQPMQNRNTLRKFLSNFFALSLTTTAVSVAQDAMQDGDVFEMSPFVVNTSGDVGYLASNTLAGSRLNTSLGDTAAPISVFTAELLADLAVNDIQSATFYTLGAEQFTEAEIGNQAGNQLQNDGLQFNIRGFRATSARNYFTWGLNSDNYNVERIDYSRGPNSILFGLGSPGGIVNVSTKQAQMQDAYSAELQLSSWNGFRVSTDLNRVIVEDKFAIRLNALYNEKESWRRVQYKDDQRLHLAATYTPFSTTRIRGEIEFGDVPQVLPRPWGPLNGFAGWVASGRPAIATARGEIPDGGQSLGGNTRWVAVAGNNSSLLDWSSMGTSDPGGFNFNIFDFDLVPREFAQGGTGHLVDNEYTTYSLYLEQEITRNFNVELAYNFQESDSLESRSINWNTPLSVDINQQLPDGSPNPNFGQYYLEHSYRQFATNRERDIFRLTASYELDASEYLDGLVGRIIGRHRLAGLYEHFEDTTARNDFREVNSTPFEQLNDLRHPRNRIYRRTYIDFDTGEGINGAVDPRENPLPAFQATAANGTSGTVTPEFLIERFQGSISELETQMFAMQNYLWDGRIVTTYGNRKDTRRIKRPTVTSDRRIVTAVEYDQPFGDEESGTTETFGVVFHVLDWLSVFYNDSETTQLGATNRFTINGDPVGNEQGVGEDIGFRLNFMDNRIAVSFSSYETATVNRLTFTGVDFFNVSNNIWDAIDPSRRIDDSLPPGSTEDLVSEGYELEIIANPLENWNIMFNYSNSETNASNIAATEIAYWNANKSTFLQSSGVDVAEADPNFTTIGEAVAYIDDQIASLISPFEGRLKLAHSDDKFNLFTNYRFTDDSALKGFSVGGGARYVSKPVIGFSSTDSNGNSETFFGDDNFLLDFRVGYKTKIMDDKYDLSVNLNVRNLLDEDQIILTLADSNGNPQRYRFQNEREWILSVKLGF